MKILPSAFALSILAAASASGQPVIDSYAARIGPEDRVNSSGALLTRIDQILQQDRANLHRFGIAQPGDSADWFFSDRENRALMSRLIQAGQVDPDARQALLSGADALLLVEIHGQGGRASFVTVRTAPVAGTGTAGTAPAPAPPPAAVAGKAPAEPRVATAERSMSGAAPATSGSAATGPDGRPAFAPPLSCELGAPGRREYRLRCTFTDGRPMESNTMRAVRAQIALHTLGCRIGAIEAEPDYLADGACFLGMFGLDRSRLTDRDTKLLANHGSVAARDALIARLEGAGLTLGGEPDPAETARAFAEAVDSPLSGLFLHPAGRASFLGAEMSLDRWMTSRAGGRGVQTRWADASTLSGRTFSLTRDGAPLFLARFGDEAASVSVWHGSGSDTFDAPYRTRNGLVCAELRGAHNGACLSIALDLTGPSTARVGETWGALLHVRNGWPVPVIFAAATEGEAEWLAAVARAGAGPAPAVPAVPPLPPALVNLSDDPAMMAFWRHEADAIDTPDMADAAMRSLFALSYHVAGCHGPSPAVIPIRTTIETTTRDGFGTFKGIETDTFDSALRTRPEFADLARRLVPYYSDNLLNRRFSAVRDLISQDTCDGPRLRRFEAGLAKAAGVTLPDTPPAAAPLAIDDNWRGFVADCTRASYPAVTNNEAGAAHFCTVYDAVARQLGDAELHAELRRLGMAAGGDWSDELKARFNAAFDPIYRDREGDVWRRSETYIRDNAL